MDHAKHMRGSNTMYFGSIKNFHDTGGQYSLPLWWTKDLYILSIFNKGNLRINTHIKFTAVISVVLHTSI